MEILSWIPFSQSRESEDHPNPRRNIGQTGLPLLLSNTPTWGVLYVAALHRSHKTFGITYMYISLGFQDHEKRVDLIV